MLKVVFFLILLAPVTAAAEDAPVEPGTHPEQVEKAGENPGAPDKPDRPDVEDEVPETFDPTEEISEDYSIEFPVDI